MSNIAQGDRRPYLVVTSYYTPAQGGKELKQRTDAFMPAGVGTAYRSRTEFKYGITDRLLAALYLVTRKPAGDSVNYNQTRLEFRYRLNEPGHQFWDTAANLLMTWPNDPNRPDQMELKAIFSHEFPKFNVTLNINGIKRFEPGQRIDPTYSAGIAQNTSSPIQYSLEAFREDNGHYIMPSIWIVPGKRQHLGLGIAKGLTPSSDNIQVRTLYSIGF